MKRIIEFMKRKQEERKLREQRKQEAFLKRYFSVMYRINDYDLIEIPYFKKAESTVEDLKRRGLLSDVYKYIVKKGVKVA